MPRGPKGERRPADVIGAAIMVAKIATGEIEDTPRRSPAQARAASAGKAGGPARARTLDPEKRREIAKKGAKTRWSKSNSD
jgi:hypothetical protein